VVIATSFSFCLSGISILKLCREDSVYLCAVNILAMPPVAADESSSAVSLTILIDMRLGREDSLCGEFDGWRKKRTVNVVPTQNEPSF
jgi:hypothetical protein